MDMCVYIFLILYVDEHIVYVVYLSILYPNNRSCVPPIKSKNSFFQWLVGIAIDCIVCCCCCCLHIRSHFLHSQSQPFYGCRILCRCVCVKRVYDLCLYDLCLYDLCLWKKKKLSPTSPLVLTQGARNPLRVNLWLWNRPVFIPIALCAIPAGVRACVGV